MTAAGRLTPSLLAAALGLCACVAVPQEAPAPGMADPGTVYCFKLGGTPVPRETAAGTATDCLLPDGRLIDAADLLRAGNS